MIEYKTIRKLIFKDFIEKIETNMGISTCVKERAKFEGWVKVELCAILSKYYNVTPEYEYIDIVAENWAIELKTINTSYHHENATNKTRPITDNINSVLKDIEKLGSRNHPNKAVLFIVFPLALDNIYWERHLSKISSKLSKLECKEILFLNHLPGLLYLGLL